MCMLYVFEHKTEFPVYDNKHLCVITMGGEAVISAAPFEQQSLCNSPEPSPANGYYYSRP